MPCWSRSRGRSSARDPRRRPPLPLRRRRVRGDPAGRGPRSRPRGGRPDPARRRRRCRSRPAGRRVTISVGVACYPDDGRTKDALVAIADRALYLAKPVGRSRDGTSRGDDPYLRALDETALALLDRHDPTILLETILTRADVAARARRTATSTSSSPGEAELVVRHGTGLFAQGHRPSHAGRRGPRRPGLPDRPARSPSTTTTPSPADRRDRPGRARSAPSSACR